MRRLVIPLVLCAAIVFAAVSTASPHSTVRVKRPSPVRSLAVHVP